MSYVYAEGEVSRKEWLPARYVAPLPDYVAAAGTVFKEALSRQYVPDRVLLTGAIRYPEIQLSYAPGNDGVVGLDDRNAVKILVVGSMVRNETLTLLRVSAEIARTRPDILLLLKFHYHLPLHEEWNRLAAEYGCRRFKVYESNLTALLKVADAVILPATTAVVVEAIALGCMPVVFQNNTEYTGFCPAMDIREALFLCDEISGFVDALNHCLNRTQAYWERRQAWPDALEKMFYRLDGLQNERLFEALRSRGVL
jgi:surface carbohydrate biosynthesis protein (TIGR04326 family)